MASDKATVLLALEGTGGGLRVVVQPRALTGVDERWFDLQIVAAGHPFEGTITEILTDADLVLFRDNLARLAAPGEVVLGGERAAELRLRVEAQVGGEAGRWVVEASLTPSGDDPYPLLRWLIFDQHPFVANAVRAVDQLLASPS